MISAAGPAIGAAAREFGTVGLGHRGADRDAALKGDVRWLPINWLPPLTRFATPVPSHESQ